MADLPNNQSYGGSNAPQIPNLKVPTPPPRVQAMMDEMGLQPTSVSSGGGPMDFGSYFSARGITPGSGRGPNLSVLGTEELPRNPTGTSLGAFMLGERAPETLPVGQDYIDLQRGLQEPGLGTSYGAPGSGLSWPAPNLETLDFRAPQAIEGQYIIDRSNPGNLVKSGRSLTPQTRQKLLGGRPSHLYEVDHIIPLWLGGADTEDNYQLLDLEEHQKKTRVQSIAQTLLYHNKISRAEAFVMATNWKDRDDTDIPSYQSGQLTAEVAEQIAERWKTQDNFKGGFFAGIFARTGDSQADKAIRKQARKDFVDVIRTGASTQNLYQNVAEQFGYTGEVRLDNPLASASQEFIKGAASGLTAGWATYVPAEEANAFDNFAGVVGNFAGMMAPVVGITKGLAAGRVLTARKLAGASRAVQGSKAAGAAAKVAGGAQATAGLVSQTASKMGSVSRAAQRLVKAPFGRATLGVPEMAAGGIKTTIQLRNAVSAAIARTGMRNIFINAAALGIYGQFGPRGLAGQLAGEEEANAVRQGLEDLVWGIASPVGGSMLGSFGGRMVRGGAAAGAMPSLPAHAIQEGLGAFTASFGILMMMEGDQTTLNEKIVNSAVMAGLHLMGVSEQRKNWGQYVEAIQAESHAMAANNLNVYLPRVKKVKSGEPVTQTFSPEDLLSMREEAISKIDDLYARGMIDKRTHQNERVGIGASIDALESAGLTPQQLQEKNLKTFFELRSRAQIIGNRIPQQTPGLGAFVQVLPPTRFKDSNLHYDGRPSGDFPTTKVSLKDGEKVYERLVVSAGSEADFNPNPANLQSFNEYKQSGQASPTLIISSEPEMAPFWRAQNLTRTQEQVDSRQHVLHRRPENTLQIWGQVREADGSLRLIPVGHVARRSSVAHVSEGGRATSSNTKIGNKKDDNFYIRPEQNKDTYATAMNEKGTRFLTANLFSLTQNKEGNLTLTFTVNDANWNESLLFNNQIKSNPAYNQRTVAEASLELQTTRNPQRREEVRREIQEKTQQPASEILVSPIAGEVAAENREGITLTRSILQNIEEALSAKNADEMAGILGERFGITLSPAEASSLFGRRSKETVAGALDLLARKGNQSTKNTITNFVKPMVESPSFIDGWMYGGAFRDLRVLGNIEVPPPAGGAVRGAQAEGAAPVAPKTARPETQKLADQVAESVNLSVPPSDAVTPRGTATSAPTTLKVTVKPKTAEVTNKVSAAAIAEGEAPRTEKSRPAQAGEKEVALRQEALPLPEGEAQAARRQRIEPETRPEIDETPTIEQINADYASALEPAISPARGEYDVPRVEPAARAATQAAEAPGIEPIQSRVAREAETPVLDVVSEAPAVAPAAPAAEVAMAAPGSRAATTETAATRAPQAQTTVEPQTPPQKPKTEAGATQTKKTVKAPSSEGKRSGASKSSRDTEKELAQINKEIATKESQLRELAKKDRTPARDEQMGRLLEERNALWVRYRNALEEAVPAEADSRQRAIRSFEKFKKGGESKTNERTGPVSLERDSAYPSPAPINKKTGWLDEPRPIKQKTPKPQPKTSEGRLRATREDNVRAAAVETSDRLQSVDKSKDIYAYIDSLSSIVNTSTAYPTLAATGKGALKTSRGLGPKEAKMLDAEVRNRIRSEALDLAEGHSGVDEALRFVGIDPEIPHARKLYYADIAVRLGDSERAATTLSGITPRELKQSAKSMDQQLGGLEGEASNRYQTMVSRLERQTKKTRTQKRISSLDKKRNQSPLEKLQGKAPVKITEAPKASQEKVGRLQKAQLNMKDPIEKDWATSVYKILQKNKLASTKKGYDKKQVEKAGSQYVESIKKNKQSKDEYASVKAHLVEAGLKKMGFDLDSEVTKEVLGRPLAINPNTKRGQAVQDRMDQLTETLSRKSQGKALTHTRTFIQARGMGSDTASRLLSGIRRRDPKILAELESLDLQVSDLDKNGNMDVIPFLRDIAAGRRESAVKRATKSRKAQTDTHAEDRERGAFSKKIDDIEDHGVSNEDLASGSVRLLSTTQDIGQTQEISQLYSRQYPALTAALDAGRTPTRQEAKLDAYSELLAIIQGAKQVRGDGPQTKVRFPFLKGVDMRNMTPEQKQKWFDYNEAKTKKFINDSFPGALRKFQANAKKK